MACIEGLFEEGCIIVLRFEPGEDVDFKDQFRVLQLWGMGIFKGGVCGLLFQSRAIIPFPFSS